MDVLFKRYTDAFDALDAEAIAQLYRIPCAISDADGVQVYSDKASLLAKFEANCQTLKGSGYQKAEFNILNIEHLGEDKASVTVGWRVELQGGTLEFRSLYICHLIEEEWRIFSANVYEGKFGVS